MSSWSWECSPAGHTGESSVVRLEQSRVETNQHKRAQFPTLSSITITYHCASLGDRLKNTQSQRTRASFDSRRCQKGPAQSIFSAEASASINFESHWTTHVLIHSLFFPLFLLFFFLLFSILTISMCLLFCSSAVVTHATTHTLDPLHLVQLWARRRSLVARFIDIKIDMVSASKHRVFGSARLYPVGELTSHFFPFILCDKHYSLRLPVHGSSVCIVAQGLDYTASRLRATCNPALRRLVRASCLVSLKLLGAHARAQPFNYLIDYI